MLLLSFLTYASADDDIQCNTRSDFTDEGFAYRGTGIACCGFTAHFDGVVEVSNGIIGFQDNCFRAQDKMKLRINEDSRLEFIPRRCFESFSSPFLTTFMVPKTVKWIGVDAFRKSEFNAIIFSTDSELSSIYSGAFSELKFITSLKFYSELTHIGDGAFNGSTSLRSFETNSVRYTNFSTNLFSGSTNLVNLIITDTDKCKVIGDNAFSGTSITSLLIPRGVTSIGQNAFPSTLTQIEYYGTANYSGLDFGFSCNSSKNIPVFVGKDYPYDKLFGCDVNQTVPPSLKPDPTPRPNNSASKTAAIVGGSLGGIIFILIAVVVLIIVFRKKIFGFDRDKNVETQEQLNPDEEA